MKFVAEEWIVNRPSPARKCDTYLRLAQNGGHCLRFRPIPIRNSELIGSIKPLGLIWLSCVLLGDRLGPLCNLHFVKGQVRSVPGEKERRVMGAITSIVVLKEI